MTQKPELKTLLGRMLGEIYRDQLKSEDTPCPFSEATVYGLLHGFESVIDDVIEATGHISKQQLAVTIDLLNEYFQDPQKLQSLTGFYDIERLLQSKGVSRFDAIKIFTYLSLSSQFTDVLRKLNSTNSPVECKEFKSSEFDH